MKVYSTLERGNYDRELLLSEIYVNYVFYVNNYEVSSDIGFSSSKNMGENSSVNVNEFSLFRDTIVNFCINILIYVHVRTCAHTCMCVCGKYLFLWRNRKFNK